DIAGDPSIFTSVSARVAVLSPKGTCFAFAASYAGQNTSALRCYRLGKNLSTASPIPGTPNLYELFLSSSITASTTAKHTNKEQAGDIACTDDGTLYYIKQVLTGSNWQPPLPLPFIGAESANLIDTIYSPAGGGSLQYQTSPDYVNSVAVTADVHSSLSFSYHFV